MNAQHLPLIEHEIWSQIEPVAPFVAWLTPVWMPLPAAPVAAPTTPEPMLPAIPPPRASLTPLFTPYKASFTPRLMPPVSWFVAWLRAEQAALVNWLDAWLTIWSMREPDDELAMVGITRAIALVTVLWQFAAWLIAFDKLVLARFCRWIARSRAARLAEVACPQ